MGSLPCRREGALAAIFISFSSRDREQALLLCRSLEERGRACWIASRDVRPGQNYQEEIVQAIRSAPLMVLVFSANANASNEIKKELALASQRNMPVLPVRIADVEPSGAFVYEMATRQWIDLFRDRDSALRELIAHIEAALGPLSEKGAVPSFNEGPFRETATAEAHRTGLPAGPEGRRTRLMVLSSLAVLLLAAVGAWAIFGGGLKTGVVQQPGATGAQTARNETAKPPAPISSPGNSAVASGTPAGNVPQPRAAPPAQAMAVKSSVVAGAVPATSSTAPVKPGKPVPEPNVQVASLAPKTPEAQPPSSPQPSPGAAAPAEFVTANLSRILETLSGGTPEEKFANFGRAAQSSFDFDRIAAFTLGAARRSASATDLAEFTRVYRVYQQAALYRFLSRYAGARVAVQETQQRAPTDWIVTVKLNGSDTAAFRTQGSEKLVFTDVSFAGIWLSLTQRDQFTANLTQNGGSIPALSAKLGELTATLLADAGLGAAAIARLLPANSSK